MTTNGTRKFEHTNLPKDVSGKTGVLGVPASGFAIGMVLTMLGCVIAFVIAAATSQ